MVEEGHDRVLGVPGAVDHFRCVKQVGRQHRQRQMGLDDAGALEIRGELDRISIEAGHPVKHEIRIRN